MLLLTGRTLDELTSVCPGLDLFEDESLAREVVVIAAGSQVQASDSRRLVRDAIARRYMLPYGQE
jgi:hypothetical protein